ncbi:unnamed protein product [Malus baccata var. baccata]
MWITKRSSSSILRVRSTLIIRIFKGAIDQGKTTSCEPVRQFCQFCRQAETLAFASILSSSRRRLPSLTSVVLLLLSLSLESYCHLPRMQGSGPFNCNQNVFQFWTLSFLNLCASLGFLMAVLRKSKKKEEPVLEDLPKEYYDDSKP